MGLMASFYGNPALARLPDQVRESRPILQSLLRLLPKIRRSQGLLTLLCAAAIFVYPRGWFAFQPRRIYGVTLTINNTRALRRLNPELTACDPDFALNHRSLTLRARIRLVRAAPDMARQIKKSDSPDAFVILNQLLAIVCLHAFHEDLLAAQPRLVVAANDHSPPTVALFHAARALQIPTVYIQHGHVTPNFPPLYTDLAVLYSPEAANSYHAAANRAMIESGTQILLLPVIETPAKPIEAVRSPLSVCLALSKFVDVLQLQDIIKTLRDSGQVSEICIARHPRCTNVFRDLSSDIVLHGPGTSPATIAETVDLCLVGNSGVALEFLHAGCPTYYLPPTDPLLHDYYGFCRAGLLPLFDATALKSAASLAAPFRGDWQKRMERFGLSHLDRSSHLRDRIMEHLRHLIQDEADGRVGN